MLDSHNASVAILFRFHDDIPRALERLRILKHFNPSYPIHVFFGGDVTLRQEVRDAFSHCASVWVFEGDKPASWKWQHTDLMLKDWYRQYGSSFDFDFLYSYEYDLISLLPLQDLYPAINQKQIALSACQPFTKRIEDSWTWTSREDHRPAFLSFCRYLEKTYGIKRQKMVCLGPGPLFSRTFLEAWALTEDQELVHDELSYPAYAEILEFGMVNNTLHPGFSQEPEVTKLFNCNSNRHVSFDMIREAVAAGSPRRAFHPVKEHVSLDRCLQLMQTAVSS